MPFHVEATFSEELGFEGWLVDDTTGRVTIICHRPNVGEALDQAVKLVNEGRREDAPAFGSLIWR